ncbi:TonB-dependent receptor domain-containing protein [Stenotrophomonas sp. UBA7606]|uniref:TonB-dependent receptor domain-containing protein n=1 Tax=Stenotrophomonas sp. UBA7606 TaxID=1947559 RepID=UPI0025CBD334|nr:TonB-dependent receptor [Stenotrophomonas sp. UBA7606]
MHLQQNTQLQDCPTTLPIKGASFGFLSKGKQMTYRNSLSRNPLSYALASALAFTSAAPAFAQEAAEQKTNPPASAATTDLDRVSVVGSRIKRVDVEGPAPVTVITRADIDREGFQTVGDMLQTLSQNTSASFTGDLAVSGFTPNAQVVNLRNLGPGYTLTLINGRRPAQYPQPYNRDNNVVNVKAIPMAIVERMEVLTGGASAIYGSDAVAGVVNIVLRENFDGNELRGTAGTTQEGGGDSINLEYTGGRSGDRWSTTFALQYGENEPVFGTQRDFMADTRNNPWGLTLQPSLSLVAISAAGLAGPAGHNILELTPEQCAAFGYAPGNSPTRGDWCGSYTQDGSRSIWNKNSFYSGYISGKYDFNDNIEGFSSLTYYEADSKASSGTEFWGTGGSPFTPAGVFYDPNFGDLLQLQRVFNPFELGGNEAASTLYSEKTWDITLGARGTFADRFDWEVYAAHSEYSYKSNTPRLLAKAVHDYFLGDQLGTISGYPIYELNMDRYTSPITPDIYRSFSTRVINKGETSSSTLNFNFSGDLFELPAGPLGFAGVIEGVRQATTLESDPRTNPLRPIDEQTVYNLVSSGRTDGERDRYAIGAEFRVPIFDSLSANLAARWDKYDDITAVDDAVTYNLGLEWRPFSNLLVRGTYATSFKAPDMQLVYAEGAASYASILDEYSCRSGLGLGQPLDANGNPIPRRTADCNVSGDRTIYQAQSTIAGNPGLKEEEGKSISAGFVWDIIDGMSLSVDYWRIKLEDAASQLDSSYLLETEAACRLGSYEDPSKPAPSASICNNVLSLITRTSAPGTTLDGRVERINQAYVNTALRDISGIDSTFRYRLITDRWGTFRFENSYSLNLTNKYKELQEDPLVDYRDMRPIVFYPERSRLRATASWEYNDWTTTLYASRMGSAWTKRATTPNQCYTGVNSGICWGRRLAPFILWNASVAKDFGPNVTAQFTVVNAFNKQYRNDPGNNTYPYFDPYIGADPLGRRFYMSVSYKF